MKGHRSSYSSTDGNNSKRLSAEIQVQPRSGISRSWSRSPSTEPLAYGSLGRPMNNGPLTLQPPPLSTVIPIERYHISRGNGAPPYTQYPPPDGGSYVTSGHTSPEPETNVILRPPPPVNVASIAPVQMLGYPNTSTLPKSGTAVPVPVSEYMQRNGSVPRLRDFDGQSSVSQETQPAPGGQKSQGNVYQPPYMNSAVPAPQLTKPQEIFIDCPVEPVQQHHSPAPGTSQDWCKEAPAIANPPPKPKKMPKPKPKRLSSGSGSSSSLKPKNWEKEFADRPKQPTAYAYINRDYQEKVVGKLLRQQSETGGEGIADDSMNWAAQISQRL